MMKKLFINVFILTGLFVFSSAAFAQKPIDQKIQRDPSMELDALNNLDVARYYFKQKKAYKAVIMRTEEIIAANPDFSKFDEVLYLAGMSSFNLAQGKGKQKIDDKATDEEKKKFAPEKLRGDAGAYLSQLVEKYPDSKFKAEAEKTLKTLSAQK